MIVRTSQLGLAAVASLGLPSLADACLEKTCDRGDGTFTWQACPSACCWGNSGGGYPHGWTCEAFYDWAPCDSFYVTCVEGC